MTWQRLARGVAPLWIVLILAWGLSAQSHAQDAPSSAGIATEGPSPPILVLEPAPALDPILVANPPPFPRLPGPVIDRIDRAWNEGSRALRDRAARTRAVADEVGVDSVDSLGRALVFGGKDLGTFEERAEAAVLLAPDLPAAHAALARARFASGSLGAAFASAIDAIASLPRTIDGWLWLGAVGGVLSLFALAGGALVYIGARGLASLSNAAHDLGDRIESSMPDFSRAALVAALVLLPAAFGEGVVGAGLALFVFAWCQSARAQRIALACAAILLVIAIHPVANLAGARFAAIGADPIVAAAVAADAGALDPVAAARLARSASDPLATYALAAWERRSGDLAGADARLTALLTRASDDPVVLASAASTKIALGAPKEAVELYRRAIATEPSALLWFNLSQAHGRAIDVEQHARALAAAAQSLDLDTVRELTTRLGRSRGTSVADLPMPQERLRDRLANAGAIVAADRLRSALAPGWLGRSTWIAAIAFAAAAVLGTALSRRFQTSTNCLDCGTRLCPHCGTAHEAIRDGVAAAPRCESCRSRRIEMRATAGWEPRVHGARAWRVRAANAVGMMLPGLAGRSASRPALGLIAALCAAGAVAFGLGSNAVLPDPARVGGAGAITFGLATLFCVVLYVAITLLSARLDRRRRA